jgi:hypothetical protein
VIANGVEVTPFNVALTSGDTAAQNVTAITNALVGKGTGLTVGMDSNSNIVFTGTAGESFKISVSGDTAGVLGLGKWTAATGTAVTTGTVDTSGTTKSSVYSFSVNGGTAIQVSVDASSAGNAQISAGQGVRCECHAEGGRNYNLGGRWCPRHRLDSRGTLHPGFRQ